MQYLRRRGWPRGVKGGGVKERGAKEGRVEEGDVQEWDAEERGVPEGGVKCEAAVKCEGQGVNLEV